jgi:hypothetical protein
MMKSLLIVAATTTVASANTIDLFATSAFDSSSYLIGAGSDGYAGQYIQANSGMDSVVDPSTGESVEPWLMLNNYSYGGGQQWLASDAQASIYEPGVNDHPTDGLFGDGGAHKFWSPPWIGQGGGAAMLLDVAKLNAGDVLDWSIDMYTPSGDGLGRSKDNHRAYVVLGIQYADGGAAEIQASNSFDWSVEGIQNLFGTYTLTGQETQIEFKYGIHNDGDGNDWGAVVMDNRQLSLTQVPAPGALALLGMAAVGRRRRK